MHAVFTKIVGKTAEIGGRLVLQIVVSVTATVCVAAITNSFLNNRTAEETSAPQGISSFAPQTAVGLLNANFTVDGFRSPVRSIDEFAAVFGPNDDRFFTLPAAMEWSSDTQVADLKPEKPVPSKTRQAVASACAEECRRLPVTSILPPARPVVEAPVEVAQAAMVSGEAPEGRSLQILGVSLPNLVPSPERILTQVTSWSGAVADLVLK